MALTRAFARALKIAQKRRPSKRLVSSGALALLGVGSSRGAGETTTGGIGVADATGAALQPHRAENNNIGARMRAGISVYFFVEDFLPLEVIFRPQGEK
jgi:hypothetical protein